MLFIKDKLYNLEIDPQEKKNAIDQEPEIAQRLRDEMYRFIDWKKERLTLTSEEMTKEEIDTLKRHLLDLGYI